MNRRSTAGELAASWKFDPRWKRITRPYSAEDVMKMRGSFHTNAPNGLNSTSASKDSTEEEHFADAMAGAGGEE